MNSIVEFVERLKDHNTLRFNGDQLLYRASAGGINGPLLEEIVSHRAEIVEVLRTRERELFVECAQVTEHRASPPLLRRFEEYAQVNPGAPAVKFEQTELTYGELDSQADALAALLQQRGLKPDDFCALCMEPSLAMVRAILAIVKSGGAYVQLDPALSATHMALILADLKATTVLAQQKFARKFTAVWAEVIVCNEDTIDVPNDWPREHVRQPSSPAYAVCTCGSTGRLNIVVNEHQDLIDRLERMQETHAIGPGESVLHLALQRADYDVSIWEFLWPLTRGARLVIARPGAHLDLEYMQRLIAREHISAMHFVPSMLQPILSCAWAGELNSSCALFCSGEALTLGRR